MQIQNITTKEKFEVTGSVNCASEQAISEDGQIVEGAQYTNYSFVSAEGVVDTTSFITGETTNADFVLLGE